MGKNYSNDYLAKRFAIVKAQEGVFTAIYVDGSGHPTIGTGTLLYHAKNKTLAPASATVKDNSSDPATYQKVIDKIIEIKGDKNKIAESFVTGTDSGGNTALLKFKAKNADGSITEIDISNLLPEKGAMKVFETRAQEFETGVDNVLKAAGITDVTDVQRAALFSRMYNTGPGATAGSEKLASNDPTQVLEFFSKGRGGAGNPGHYSRTISEVEDFLGEKVTQVKIGDSTGFSYSDKNGDQVFIGSRRIPGAKKGEESAEVVAYKVMTHKDLTQTQEPVALPNINSRIIVAPNTHFPVDPAVELNNAKIDGDPSKILQALTLDPSIKTPQAALVALKAHSPEVGELQDINLGTDAKPVWAKGYVLTDDAGKTTVFAIGKDAKGKAGLVGYEIEAPTDAEPHPAPHAIPVSSPQSKIL
jgi:GH24 family phage-related lysozyme (muramidase)